MVVVVVVPFVGGGSWLLVVGVGGWWWCSCRHVGGAGHSLSFVGGTAGRSTLVICVVIGCVVVIWRHFISRGDVAADMSAGLPIGEG